MDIDYKGLAHSSPSPEQATLQRPMNLLNKEASRPQTSALHFLPRPSQLPLPAKALSTVFTGTYFVDPLSPDKIISTSQRATQ